MLKKKLRNYLQHQETALKDTKSIVNQHDTKARRRSTRYMVVAFDIDDTISRHPQFFSFLTRALIAAGHEVLIITFRQERLDTESDLLDWGIAWTRLITSTLEACMAEGVDEWKASECRKAGVDVFFEDDLDVLKHIDPKTVCLQPYLRPDNLSPEQFVAISNLL